MLSDDQSTDRSQCDDREHMPGGGGAQGVPQRVPQMPSIPFADPAAAASASSASAQQAGRPFNSAEMVSPALPVSMGSVFPDAQVQGQTA